MNTEAAQFHWLNHKAIGLGFVCIFVLIEYVFWFLCATASGCFGYSVRFFFVRHKNIRSQHRIQFCHVIFPYIRNFQ